MANIPSVDLNNFLSDDPMLKQEFVNKLGKAYQDIGFVALKGHFLIDSDIENIYKYIKVFFDLPDEIKCKYERKGFAGQRGYTSFGQEHAKGKNIGDLNKLMKPYTLHQNTIVFMGAGSISSIAKKYLNN